MLGRVIRELADPNYKKDCYVPYRDSGLTYLLKDSLGGNARTAFIVTVHPNKRFIHRPPHNFYYSILTRISNIIRCE